MTEFFLFWWIIFNQTKYFFLSMCLIHQAFVAHILWYQKNMELTIRVGKNTNFIQRPKLRKNMQFSMVADIYMARWNSDEMKVFIVVWERWERRLGDVKINVSGNILFFLKHVWIIKSKCKLLQSSNCCSWNITNNIKVIILFTS